MGEITAAEAVVEMFAMLVKVSPFLAAAVMAVTFSAVGIFIVSLRSKKLVSKNTENTDTLVELVLSMKNELIQERQVNEKKFQMQDKKIVKNSQNIVHLTTRLQQVEQKVINE